MNQTQFALSLLVLGTCAIFTAAAPPSAEPDKNPQMVNLLHDARRLLDTKKPALAIERCDEVIAAFKARYGASKPKIYCARTPPESLGYMLQAAAAADKGGTSNAIALSSTWADAYFMKAYALQDLDRIAEAKSTVQLALALSPFNSQYLSELGEIYQLEKNWAKATEQFKAAEDNAPLSPEEAKANELGHARRGLAYVLVELGQLDEAEKKYQQCLVANPDDTKAKRELEYVRGLRAKGKLP